MNRFLLRTVIVSAVFLAALLYVIPTFKTGLWPYKKINLGLDLQGGMHLVLSVDTDKSLESALENVYNQIRDDLRAEKIYPANISITDNKKISFKIREKSENYKKLQEFLDDNYKDMRLLNKKTENGFTYLNINFPDKEAQHIKNMAVRQALETIRNRIDQFGVSEPDIRMQGEKNILIQLPGVKDVKRAKKLIGKTALLEFKLLNETGNINSALAGTISPDSELLYQVKENPDTNRAIKTPYLVKKRALLTGASLTDAKVQIDSQYNEPYVSIDFDKKGGKIFAKITEANVGKRLAIVLDNKIYSAPVIQEKIGGGAARITGSFTTEDASDLAIALRAGALPAPVKIIEERTVGPSLGSDSIKQGLSSVYIGGLIVIAFMLIYYVVAGLVANIVLIFNILLIAAGLAAFEATLTLPGIAGIILTIGMAVDANVIIYERIREELATGKPPSAALKAGFDRSSLTILDANVTTLIAALVLFQFGTGPVKGFAVTLSLGVLASMFTALILSKLIFEYMFIKLKIKKFSIG
ncbi:MAG: protein translocase subunit SecD [Deltaproteobacteria bacterium]|nr:protein translocase subunit SecD [Deltaproteobacteria bacterium]